MFRGRNEIIMETCYLLLSKAADFMTITSRKESDLTLKQQKERLEELEKEK